MNFENSAEATLSSDPLERVFTWLFKKLPAIEGEYEIRDGYENALVLDGFGGTYFGHPFVPGLNGIFTIYAVVEDTSNNRVMSIPSHFKSTTGQPDANGTLIVPLADADANLTMGLGESFTAIAFAESNSQVEYVEFFDNGRLFDTPNAFVDEDGTYHRGRRVEFDDEFYLADWNASELGEHILYARFTDIKGNSWLSNKYDLR